MLNLTVSGVVEVRVERTGVELDTIGVVEEVVNVEEVDREVEVDEGEVAEEVVEAILR